VTAPDTTTPDLASAVAYVLVDPTRSTGTWWVTPDRVVHYQRPTGEWTPPAIVSADDIEDSPTWKRADS